MKKQILILSIASLMLGACVSTKKFEEQRNLADKYLADRNECNDKLSNLQTAHEDLNKKFTESQASNEMLISDTTASGRKMRKLQEEYNELNDQYTKLMSQNNALLNSSTKEREQLNATLIQKEAELMKKASEINRLSKDLDAREQRVKELESTLNRQDSATTFLKNKLMEALTGFNASDLSIVQKDGKIYVSMSDKLLFKSGSFTLDEKGKDALGKVAQVLKKQNSFNIVVEGHTDNVPYKSPQGMIKDNWDLSVMRATTVTKVLVDDNKVDAKRVVASGHGEFSPVGSNADEEGKAKNRRTEIILSPDLKELYKLIKTNH